MSLFGVTLRYVLLPCGLAARDAVLLSVHPPGPRSVGRIDLDATRWKMNSGGRGDLDTNGSDRPKVVLRLPEVAALKRTSWPLNQRRLPTRQAYSTILNN
jgi:hypothetical protein